MRRSLFALAGPFVLCLAHSGHAADFYVDPIAGSPSGDGSVTSPWQTAEQVVNAGLIGATVGSGDRLLLRSGYHGEIVIGGGDFDPPLVIEADDGALPQLRRVRLTGGSGMVLRGLSISPSHAPTYETVTLVDIGGAATAITVTECHLFSEADVSSWTASDWMDRASNGVQVSGDDIVIEHNVVEHVRFGISVAGARAHVAHNTVDGFSADGLRGLGDYGIFEYNLVKNVYVDGTLDDNHDDGFQSWSVGASGVGTGEVVGVELRGNVIINYEDENQPFRATLQGIGCFDGTFVDWVIENNVIVTDHWHGITLLGARGARVVNNTVLDVNAETPGPPWISIDDHKDGTPPEGCLVRNNLATDYASASSGVTEDFNFVIDDPLALFVDPAAHDYRLLATASVIDQGTSDQAPAIDLDGVSRPQGSEVDPGAFEWHEPGVVPDGGAGGGPVDGGAGGMTAGGGAGGAWGSGGTAAGAGGSTNTGNRGGVAAGGDVEQGAVGGGDSGGAGASAGGGAGATSGSSSASDGGGCGCRVEARRGAVEWAWVALAMLGLARRRWFPRARGCFSASPSVR